MTMNESIKTIIAAVLPHVADALETYAFNANSGVEARKLARAHIEGYLISARNSGSLLDAHCDRLLDEIKTADGHRIIAACFEPAKPPINEGERSLWRWQYWQTGGFEGSLWDAIKQADSTNLAALANAFPEHVAAYWNFAHTSGYWAALRDRIDGGE